MVKKRTQPNASDSLITVDNLNYYHEKDEALTDAKLATKQKALTAGDGISLDTDGLIKCTIDTDNFATKDELDLKQDITEPTLLTPDKRIPDAINFIFTFAGKAFHYKGQVASEAALPTDAEEGDVYDTADTHDVYAFNGTQWFNLGGILDLSDYRTAAEQDLIDAQKVDKVTTANQLYGTTSAGTQSTVTYSKNANADTIVQRNNDGTLFVGTPTANNHAATKAYVDGLMPTNVITNITPSITTGLHKYIATKVAGTTTSTVTWGIQAGTNVTLETGTDGTTKINCAGGGSEYSGSTYVAVNNTNHTISLQNFATTTDIDNIFA